ncbi:MAG: CopG family transcriptional regulator [Chloroflexi bacterium]|nr:CopG family transcriptional regulator [Chloroflexota bacterium]
MSRTVTLRLEDAVYDRLRAHAVRDNRPLSNFIETAALRYLEAEEYVDEFEMEEIRANKALNESLERAHRDAKTGRGQFA